MAGAKEKPDLLKESAHQRSGLTGEKFYKGDVTLRDRRKGDAIAPTGSEAIDKAYENAKSKPTKK